MTAAVPNVVIRKRGERGLTLVELIVAFTILMLLSAMAVPLARYKVRREHERELMTALHEMRAAIDKYKDAADAGQLGPQRGQLGVRQAGPLGQGPTVTVFHQNAEKLRSGCCRSWMA